MADAISQNSPYTCYLIAVMHNVNTGSIVAQNVVGSSSVPYNGSCVSKAGETWTVAAYSRNNSIRLGQIIQFGSNLNVTKSLVTGFHWHGWEDDGCNFYAEQRENGLALSFEPWGTDCEISATFGVVSEDTYVLSNDDYGCVDFFSAVGSSSPNVSIVLGPIPPQTYSTGNPTAVSVSNLVATDLLPDFSKFIFGAIPSLLQTLPGAFFMLLVGTTEVVSVES
jgi:hypothetical protein